jgi:hypothetical protein
LVPANDDVQAVALAERAHHIRAELDAAHALAAHPTRLDETVACVLRGIRPHQLRERGVGKNVARPSDAADLVERSHGTDAAMHAQNASIEQQRHRKMIEKVNKCLQNANWRRNESLQE